MKVAPSILSADFCKMAEAVENLKAWNADIVHCDVMDGVYVPNITFGMPMIKAIRKYTDLPIDTHLMITEPEKYVDRFCEAGADIVTFHVEASKDVSGTLEKIRSHGTKCGVAVNLDKSFDIAIPYLTKIDVLVIMTVQAGFGGQSFNESALQKVILADKIRRAQRSNFLIEVDGGVSESNIAKIKEAGADIVVAGNSVFRSSNPAKTVQALQLRNTNDK